METPAVTERNYIFKRFIFEKQRCLKCLFLWSTELKKMLLTVNLVCMMLHFEIIVKMRMCKIYLIFVVVLSNCFSVCWMFKMNDDTTENADYI